MPICIFSCSFIFRLTSKNAEIWISDKKTSKYLRWLAVLLVNNSFYVKYTKLFYFIFKRYHEPQRKSSSPPNDKDALFPTVATHFSNIVIFHGYIYFQLFQPSPNFISYLSDICNLAIHFQTNKKTKGKKIDCGYLIWFQCRNKRHLFFTVALYHRDGKNVWVRKKSSHNG